MTRLQNRYDDEPRRVVDHGSALIPTESSNDAGDQAYSGIQAYIQEHFEAFVRFSAALSAFDRQILIEYYHLGKTQEQLAIVHNLSQPTIVRAIQSATRALGAVISGEKPPKNTRKRRSALRFRESEYVGQFIVELDRKVLEHIFAPHATPRCS